MIKLKNILSNRLNESPVIPSTLKAAFGEYPFAGARDNKGLPPEFYNLLVKNFKLKPEKNTEFEDKLINSFSKWYQNANKPSASEMNAAFGLLKSARVKWPSIFKPHVEDGSPLFRGMESVPSGTLSMLKNASVDNFKRVNVSQFDSSFYVYKTPIKYTPRMDAQSWTDDIEVALNFASDCILITKCNTEFIMNKKFGELWNSDEDEIIHIGKGYKEKVYVGVSEEFMWFSNKEYAKTQLVNPPKGGTNIKTFVNKLVK